MKEIYFADFLTQTIICNKFIVFESLYANNLNKTSNICLKVNFCLSLAFKDYFLE